eukprot:TRINITY_DN32462_c0_g1_i1.p1 TRINITY_DN32462_c0_g1~~TRINITY_DN32462_c0_g1_i1.p1  ORF type:complete len:433 (+),score=89.92 TRINITY_DN32462_c0_g1_i1:94-1299(+)
MAAACGAVILALSRMGDHGPAHAAPRPATEALPLDACRSLLHRYSKEHALGRVTDDRLQPEESGWLRDGVYSVLTRRASIRLWTRAAATWEPALLTEPQSVAHVVENASDPFLVSGRGDGLWLFYTDTQSRRVFAKRKDADGWAVGESTEGLPQRAYPGVVRWGGADDAMVAAGPCDLANPWEDWSRPGGHGYGLCVYATVRPGARCPDDDDDCKAWPLRWHRVGVVSANAAGFHPQLLAVPPHDHRGASTTGLWLVATDRHIDRLRPGQHRLSAYSAAAARCRVWYAPEPGGPWRQVSTVQGCGGAKGAVSGGAFVRSEDGAVWRMVQDARRHYGHSVVASRVRSLSADSFIEEDTWQRVLLPSGSGWNALGAHVLGLHQAAGSLTVAADGFAAPPQCSP